MTLSIIGIGLCDAKDITLKGLETIKKADIVYLETYTSLLQCPINDLEELYQKKIILADRKIVEQEAEQTILKDAKEKNVAFLVIGDSLSATTHTDLLLRAKEKGIKTEIIHNASILTAVGETGLQLYKFGKTTSIPFPEKEYFPETAYDVIKENKKNGLHTLILLDLRPQENKYMSVHEGLSILLTIEEKRKENVLLNTQKIIGCARLGCPDRKIRYGTSAEIAKENFGKSLHCIIIPGNLHFAEEEFLEQINK